ncbi:hypothetical protein GWI33_003594, partial [Rhynchophorus ferrugineus]
RCLFQNSFSEERQTGLPRELLQKLDNERYKVNDEEEVSSCVICLECYKRLQKLIIFPCGHRFHKACGERWLKTNTTCPVCRDDVVTHMIRNIRAKMYNF